MEEPIVVKIKKINKDMPDLKQAHTGDACYDVSANLQEPEIIPAGTSRIIGTGLCFRLPPFAEIQVRPRSGLAAKNLITVLNTPGTIDQDYTGEVKVILINHSNEDFEVKPFDRIAQLRFSWVPKTFFSYETELEKTERGDSGFGSTGVKKLSA